MSIWLLPLLLPLVPTVLEAESEIIVIEAEGLPGREVEGRKARQAEDHPEPHPR